MQQEILQTWVTDLSLFRKGSAACFLAQPTKSELVVGIGVAELEAMLPDT